MSIGLTSQVVLKASYMESLCGLNGFVGLVDRGHSSTSRSSAYNRNPSSPSALRYAPSVPSSAVKHKPARSRACLSAVTHHNGQAPPGPVKPVTTINLGHGISSGGNTSADNAMVLRSIYLDFLQRLSYSNTWEDCHPHQQELITARLSALCGSYMPRKYVSLGAGFADLVFKFHTIETRVKIAHFVALLMVADDLAGKSEGEARVRYLEDLTLFQLKYSNPEAYARLVPGRGDLHPVLEDFVVYLKSDQNPFFPTDLRLHSMLVKSVFDCMEAHLQEQHFEKHPLSYTPEMLHLPKFLRHKSGMSEPFAYFLFICMSSEQTSAAFGPEEDAEVFFYNYLYPMVPDIEDSFDLVNDILSFYKEIEDGEDSICILSNAKIHSLTPLQAVKETVEYVVGIQERVMALVDRTGSPDVKKILKTMQYLQGFISFHRGNRRYRLEEVLGGWYQRGFWL